ncbi:MAG: excinuclease ABC subunit C [Fidelibacterota bacterium]|nr:MAG: excinuclease ABC subunit C [Candidatus Neomarinimicrobiota bacterium]
MPETLTLQDKLKRLPRSPGVYLFKDTGGEIIYIGKAKVLRNRVRSYFQAIDGKDPKTRRMVPKIADLDWIVLASETEALITEQEMIRHHQPRYNLSLRDDKTHPYIRITKEPFPQVFLTRQIELGSGRYLGPYTDVKRLRETLQVLYKIFPIRTCTYHITDETISQGKYKLCLDYHIKRCEGPCEGLVSTKRYQAMIDQVVAFLQGRSDDIVAHLMGEMEAASKEIRFEDAARYRDQLQAVQHYTERQSILSQDFGDRDILAVDVATSYGVGVVMRVRKGKLLGKEKFDLVIADPQEREENFYGFLKLYYSQTEFIPGEVLVQEPAEDQAVIEGWLSARAGRKVHLVHPQRGEKARLVRMALRNATLQLNEIKLKKARRKELLPSSVERLQEDLGLEVPPRRIEGFDNSNIQGASPVSAMVCFVDGKPKKSEYRKYNIKTVTGPDDFASMHEVITRRYRRVLDEGISLPDLILIDGGKGQLSMAKAALDDLGLSYVPVIGLAKRLEEVYRPGHSEPFNIPKHSPGLSLLRRVRDEAHRFAITFHRQRRGKAMTTSVLDDIPGIGPKRLKAIWQVFDSLEEIAAAKPEEIAEKAKLPLEVAERVRGRARKVQGRAQT